MCMRTSEQNSSPPTGGVRRISHWVRRHYTMPKILECWTTATGGRSCLSLWRHHNSEDDYP